LEGDGLLYFNPGATPSLGDEILTEVAGANKLVRYTGVERSKGVRLPPDQVAKIEEQNKQARRLYLAALSNPDEPLFSR
jgi:hypothetical protein